MATAQIDPTGQLEIAGLHSTEPEPLPFGGGGLSIRAFLLERAAGNLLIYSTTGLANDGAPLRDRGPLVRHYLNHHHEAMFLPEELAAIDAPLVVGEDDRAAVADRAAVPVHAFSKRHHADPDFEVIPTPGHTPGATAYLWDTGTHRLLFTGDSLYLRDGEWVAAVLSSSDRRSYLRSLELIAGLDFDVLVPWAAGADSPPLAFVDAGEARERVAAITRRIRSGGDH